MADREVVRVVHNDACVEFETNWYSVPWQLLRERVTVRLRGEQVSIEHAGEVVAQHTRLVGRRQRRVIPEHWKGLVPTPPSQSTPTSAAPPATGELARPLDVYQDLVDEEAA